MEKCKNHTSRGTELINMDGNLITNQHKIAHSFNKYFLSLVCKVNINPLGSAVFITSLNSQVRFKCRCNL